MKVEEYDGKPGRTVLAEMIVSREVLAPIAARWDGHLFESFPSDIIGGMAVDYYDKYGKAPGKYITSLFEHWSENHDKDTVGLVETLLSEISSEFSRNGDRPEPRFVLDTAERFFNQARARKLRDELDESLSAGDEKAAAKKAQAYAPVELAGSARINLFRDRKVCTRAFENQPESIVKYGGGLGEFFGNSLHRGALISFEGREKVGKSWWLMDLGYRAVRQGLRVAVFQLGDLTQDQIVNRFQVRALGRPLESTVRRHEGPVSYPTSLSEGGYEGSVWVRPAPEFEARDYDEDATDKDIWAAFQKVVGKLGSEQCPLGLWCYPSLGINVQGVRSILLEETRRGWKPDVVVIDYPDIFAPPSSKSIESRDQINETWVRMRGLNVELDCLMIVASQIKAGGYNKETLGIEDFSEDKRKRSHTTGTIGINEPEGEVQALNWIVRRGSKYDKSAKVYCVRCLDIANPAVRSVFPKVNHANPSRRREGRQRS